MLDTKIVNNPPFVKAKYFYTGRRSSVQLICMHTMEAPEKGSTAENVANYFANITRPASAHICVDNNSAVQCVYDSNTAFACKNANANGIHIEMAGYASQSQTDWKDAYSLQLLENAAQFGAYYCNKYDIPPVRAIFKSKTDPTVLQPGFCGHTDVPLHGVHWDPGPNFPWQYFLTLVTKFL